MLVGWVLLLRVGVFTWKVLIHDVISKRLERDVSGFDFVVWLTCYRGNNTGSLDQPTHRVAVRDAAELPAQKVEWALDKGQLPGDGIAPTKVVRGHSQKTRI